MAEDRTELPIRLYDTPGGLVIACLCGLEHVPVTDRAAAIITTPATIAFLAEHARSCEDCQVTASKTPPELAGRR